MSTSRAGGDPASARTDRSTGQRSVLGTLALVLTTISVVAFVVLIIGSIADWRGFSDDPGDNSTSGDIVWTTFAISGLLALLVGIAAWVRGRNRRLFGDVRAGQLAIGWVVVAIVVSAIVSALE